MAVLGQEVVQEVPVAQTPAQVEDVVEAPVVVPENVVTLSTGLRVQFLAPLPTSKAQEIVVTAFSDANIMSDGRVRDTEDNAENLKTAKKLYEYNASLIINGVYFDALRLYDGFPKDKRWLNYLKINPSVKTAFPEADFNDEFDRTILFLFYIAFKSDDDWQVLSSRLLGR